MNHENKNIDCNNTILSSSSGLSVENWSRHFQSQITLTLYHERLPDPMPNVFLYVTI